MSDFKVGDRVANRFRRNWASGEYHPDHKGTVVGHEEGVNGGTIVKFDNRNYHSYMVTSDLVKIDE